MQEFTVGLDPDDHAGYHILSTQAPPGLGLNAAPGTGAQLAQEPAIKPGVAPQAFGNGQNHLAMGNRKTDFLDHMHGR